MDKVERKVRAVFSNSYAVVVRPGPIIGPPGGGVVIARSRVELVATTPSQRVATGQPASYTININRTNFSGAVALSARVVNTAGGTVPTLSLSPTSTSGNNSTLNVSATAQTGNFTVEVSGTASGVIIAPINVQLTVERSPVSKRLLASASKECRGGNSAFTISYIRSDGTVTSTAHRFRLDSRQCVTLRWVENWNQCQNYPWNVTGHKWFVKRQGSPDVGIEVSTAAEQTLWLDAGNWEINLAETRTAPGRYYVLAP